MLYVIFYCRASGKGILGRVKSIHGVDSIGIGLYGARRGCGSEGNISTSSYFCLYTYYLKCAVRALECIQDVFPAITHLNGRLVQRQQLLSSMSEVHALAVALISSQIDVQLSHCRQRQKAE